MEKTLVDYRASKATEEEFRLYKQFSMHIGNTTRSLSADDIRYAFDRAFERYEGD